MIKFHAVRVGEGPTVACVRCGRVGASAYRGTEDLLAELQAVACGWSASDGPGPNITFVGAEPIAHPEFDRVLAAVRSSAMERVCLHTSGTPFGSLDLCRRVLDAGVNHIRLVVLAGDAGTHDTLTGQPGSFDAALRGIRELASAASSGPGPLMLCGRVPVCDHNIAALPEAVVALAGAGVRSVELEVSHDAADSRVRPWLVAAMETGMVNGVWVAPACAPSSTIGALPGWGRSPVELCQVVAP